MSVGDSPLLLPAHHFKKVSLRESTASLGLVGIPRRLPPSDQRGRGPTLKEGPWQYCTEGTTRERARGGVRRSEKRKKRPFPLFFPGCLLARFIVRLSPNFGALVPVFPPFLPSQSVCLSVCVHVCMAKRRGGGTFYLLVTFSRMKKTALNECGKDVKGRGVPQGRDFVRSGCVLRYSCIG